MQLAENLRRIRAEKRFTQVDLARAAGISRMGYRKIEAGESEPRGETLAAIALALGVPVERLLVPVQPLSRVRFRAQKRLNSREQLLASVARQLEHYTMLEGELGEHPPAFLDELREAVASVPRRRRARTAAELARKALSLTPPEVIRDICGLLEDNGVRVLTPTVATDGFFGLSVADDHGGAAVVVNTWERITVERWIFTAAHEFAHLILHLGAYNVEQTQEDQTQEKEADEFAGYFLMPEETFKAEFDQAAGLSWYDRIFKLKRIFRVSYRTVLYRIASDLPAKDRPQVWQRFSTEYARRHGRILEVTAEPDALTADAFRQPAAKSADEPEGLEPHDFVRDRLAFLVRRALERDVITMNKAAEILDLDLGSMQDLCNSWID